MSHVPKQKISNTIGYGNKKSNVQCIGVPAVATRESDIRLIFTKRFNNLIQIQIKRFNSLNHFDGGGQFTFQTRTCGRHTNNEFCYGVFEVAGRYIRFFSISNVNFYCDINKLIILISDPY
jgi:hypothetical protein